MSLEIVKTPEFRIDAARQAAWFVENVSESIAARYLESLDEILQRLAQFPGIGPLCLYRHPKLHDVRWIPSAKPFESYIIYYRNDADGLKALRTIHGMRDLPRRLLEPPGAD